MSLNPGLTAPSKFLSVAKAFENSLLFLAELGGGGGSGATVCGKLL